MEVPDAALVASARGGDVQAFGRLYAGTHRRLYNFIRSLVSSDDDAADLTQETYVRAWKSLGSLRADEAFLVWLHRIARNAAQDHRKRAILPTVSLENAAADGEAGDILEIPDLSGEPEAIMQSRATRDVVRRAVDSLPEIHRSVVTLHHLEGMSVADIARTLDISQGTVLSRLSRARETLRRKLSLLVEA
ncbi:MAG: sigma-70 family RNA polymerase sigma factor [Armatimonadetes bacterium]|nr:sigma-70 family RNA polymerase sigma factor [Armatimonadota bacterium]